MSRVPASASRDGYVIVASHLSNVPSRETEALTANRTELPSFVIWITGISAEVCASIPSAKNTRLTQTAALGKKFIDYYLHFLMAIRWRSGRLWARTLMLVTMSPICNADHRA